MRVRIAPGTPHGPVVLPVPVGQARPGFAGRAGEAAWRGRRWLVALGDDAEAAGALAASRLDGAAARDARPAGA